MSVWISAGLFQRSGPLVQREQGNGTGEEVRLREHSPVSRQTGRRPVAEVVRSGFERLAASQSSALWPKEPVVCVCAF